MDDLIIISWLNDFLFCPVSIYFHALYGNADRTLYQDAPQLNGTAAHKTVDRGTHSTRSNVITGMDVLSEKYGIVGKIDIFYEKEGRLVERKKHISAIYPGYIMQIYAQCIALREMGFSVKKLQIRSVDDNKVHDMLLPEDSPEHMAAFEQLITNIREFDMTTYTPTSKAKCNNCIYEPACDRSIAAAE